MTSQFKQMQSALYADARRLLLEGVESLPPAHQRVFRLMYGRDSGRRSVGDSETIPIEVVVAEVPNVGLDWAMQQVQNSHDKISAEPTL